MDWKRKIVVRRGDITKEPVDAIVNAANARLVPGGGVDGAIHRAAGPGLAAECAGIGGCPTGEAVITDAHDLFCRKVIHTVGPVWSPDGGAQQAVKLASCYRESLRLCDEAGLKTIAFPCISTGVYGYPPRDAGRIALDAIRAGLRTHPGIDTVVCVCFSDADFDLYERMIGESE